MEGRLPEKLGPGQFGDLRRPGLARKWEVVFFRAKIDTPIHYE